MPLRTATGGKEPCSAVSELTPGTRNLAWFILDLFGAKKSLTLSTVLDDFARWKSATRMVFQGQIKRFPLIVGPKRACRSAEFVKEFFPPE